MNARTILAALAACFTTSCYVTVQGYHFLSDQVRARPLERVERQEIDLETRAFFEQIRRIRQFGITELGLTDTRTYTTFVETERTHLVNVVSAVRELTFERYEWRYPLFGAMPYRGYYALVHAQREAQRLKDSGYDVLVRPVEAFSSLGYFRDPLYSFMVSYDEPRLAELILHEMAHATVWIAEDVPFNEGFATFVGQVGAQLYAQQDYAESSDRRRFVEDLRTLRKQLEDVYDEEQPDDVKREKKAQTITEFQRRFALTYDGRYETERFRGFSDAGVNNAYIDLFSTYTDRTELFRTLTEEQGSLAAMIAWVKRVVQEHPDDPVQYIRSRTELKISSAQ